MKYIWYNPDTEKYELGLGDCYKQQKFCSNNPEGFTLLYKINASTMHVGQKLITELNKARTENSAGKSPAFALS